MISLFKHLFVVACLSLGLIGVDHVSTPDEPHQDPLSCLRSTVFHSRMEQCRIRTWSEKTDWALVFHDEYDAKCRRRVEIELREDGW